MIPTDKWTSGKYEGDGGGGEVVEYHECVRVRATSENGQKRR